MYRTKTWGAPQKWMANNEFQDLDSYPNYHKLSNPNGRQIKWKHLIQTTAGFTI